MRADGKAVLGFEEVDNLSSDVFFRGILDLPALREGAKTLTPRVQGLIDGYVAGYNRFLKDAGADGIPAECRGKAWVRPITTDDMLRLNEKQMLLASSLALAPGIANAAPARSTLQDAALTANAQASGNAAPCASSAAKAPLKQSPAPVGSTSVTAKAGWCRFSLASW